MSKTLNKEELKIIFFLEEFINEIKKEKDKEKVNKDKKKIN